MKRLFPLALCTMVLSSPALACSPPSAPAGIPDGKNASKEAMLAAKKEVDKYKRDVESYLGCERNDRKAEPVQAELERVATRFNAAVRAFKSANAET